MLSERALQTSLLASSTCRCASKATVPISFVTKALPFASFLLLLQAKASASLLLSPWQHLCTSTEQAPTSNLRQSAAVPRRSGHPLAEPSTLPPPPRCCGPAGARRSSWKSPRRRQDPSSPSRPRAPPVTAAASPGLASLLQPSDDAPGDLLLLTNLFFEPLPLCRVLPTLSFLLHAGTPPPSMLRQAPGLRDATAGSSMSRRLSQANPEARSARICHVHHRSGVFPRRARHGRRRHSLLPPRRPLRRQIPFAPGARR